MIAAVLVVDEDDELIAATVERRDRKVLLGDVTIGGDRLDGVVAQAAAGNR